MYSVCNLRLVTKAGRSVGKRMSNIFIFSWNKYFMYKISQQLSLYKLYKLHAKAETVFTWSHIMHRSNTGIVTTYVA